VPADLPFIADVKRGDISSTSERHAAWLFDRLGADAVTVSPYTGEEGIAPLLDRPDRFVYVLCRTSNPGAGELQDLLVVGEADEEAHAAKEPSPLYVHVARRVASWDAGRGTCGLVVGATAPESMAAVREAAPGLPFLVPGVGRQGGDVDTARSLGPVSAGPAAELPGGGLLVNVSRAIAEAAAGSKDPGDSLEGAGRDWAERLRV
jgi:orotidine-5'-phosphate decarboxylase